MSTRVGIGLSAGIVGVFGLTQVPFPHHSLFVDAILDAGHAPLFAVFTWFAWSRLRRSSMPNTQALGAALALAVVLGVLTEGTQYFTARNADLGDFLRDLTGAGAVGILVLTRTPAPFTRSRRRAPLRLLRIGILAALLAVPALPLLRIAQAYHLRDAAFPVLFDAEFAGLRGFVQLRDAKLGWVPLSPSLAPRESEEVARITFERANYPALILQEPVANWSQYAWLEFEIELPAGPAPGLFLRVDDAHHDDDYTDRFNRRVPLEVGRNVVRIPLEEVRRGPVDRPLDLERIAAVVFFVHPSPAPSTLILRRVRLIDGA